MDLWKIWNDYRTNRIIAGFWLGVITFLTLSPHVHTPVIIVSWQDKIEHVGAFIILAIFICRSFDPDTRFGLIERVLTAILIVTIYGALDEMIQGFVPNRDASLWDLMADVLGAFLGGIFFLYIPFLNNVR